MLRHYDEIGLFHPAAVDANGYRRYHPAQLACLHWIVALRDLGFGLVDKALMPRNIHKTPKYRR